MNLWNANPLLQWETETEAAGSLPVCRFLADLPIPYPPETPAPEGMAETDPWFILGNPAITVFPHVSGSYQIVTGFRGFARLNHDGSKAVTGRACRSIVKMDEREIDLLQTPAAEKVFGCGFAQWTWQIADTLQVTRRIDLLPAQDPADLLPAFRLTMTFRNTGDQSVSPALTEGVGARYHFANWHNPPRNRRHAWYPVQVTREDEGHTLRAQFAAQPLRPLVFGARGELSTADGFPPSLCLSRLGDLGELRSETIDDEAAWLLAEAKLALQPGEERALALVIGWEDDAGQIAWKDSRSRLPGPVNEIRELWREKLPDLADEPDPALRGELQWHAHVLEAMATWDARFGCTFIPQGTIYEYGVGVAACTRDHAMHALPACHFDPPLAASVLAWLCRHTDFLGRIQHTDEGAGIVPMGSDEKSDNQLFALLLLIEYLEVTGNLAILDDPQPCYPPGTQTSLRTLEHVANWVRFLRDVVHTGAHGLVRIMNSDLSDTLHNAFQEKRYSQVFNGESHVNSGLAVHVLRRLAEFLEPRLAELAQADLARDLVAACRDYQAQLETAFLAELEDRPWCPRGRVGDDVLGGEDAFAAPQAFIFSNPELSVARRREIWQNVKPRLWDDEPFGVRLREGDGRHRCGMVWYAWTGLFAWNLVEIDPDAARETLHRLTLQRRAEIAPEQWVGLWSHSDVTWSYPHTPDGQIPGATRVGYVKSFPQPCAHVHAWPLALYYRLARPSQT